MFLIYGVTILCAGVRSILTKQNGRINGSASLFNFTRAFSAFVLFGILALISGFQIHCPTLLYGVAYGILFFGSCFCGFRAMQRGPLGITSSLVTFSLVIPCVIGAVFLEEKIGLFDIIGFVLVAVAIVMMNKKKRATSHHGTSSYHEEVKKAENEPKFKKGWWIYVLGTIVCDGLHATIKTLHQTSYPSLYRFEFMCVGMLVGSVAFLFLMYKNRRIIKERGKERGIKCAVYGVIAGIANGAYNYLVLYLAGTESAMALFPIVSVATIAIGLLSGWLIFKERLHKMQIVGVLIAAVAIFFIKI
ncbi:MAG: EamA family transporter [Clostridia bacterium]|nr:EamA family transporter [Clostridia bacterium]